MRRDGQSPSMPNLARYKELHGDTVAVAESRQVFEVRTYYFADHTTITFQKRINNVIDEGPGSGWRRTKYVKPLTTSQGDKTNG